MKDENTKYERLTHQKYDENIDLTKEYGYSYIYKRLYELEDKIEAGNLVEPSTPKYGQNRHVYLDFPDFTQESCYEITSKVTFQDGVKDEIKTTIVCDDPYDAMKMVKEFLLSKKDWLVTEVHGQRFESGALLVTKPEKIR